MTNDVQKLMSALRLIEQHYSTRNTHGDLTVDRKRIQRFVKGGKLTNLITASRIVVHTANQGPTDAWKMLKATLAWQAEIIRCRESAKSGNLRVHRREDGTIVVNEPRSGLGVKFIPNTNGGPLAGQISSDNGQHDDPNIFDGLLSGKLFANRLTGYGIGRWIYLKGEELTFPASKRWPTITNNQREDSGSPGVRAWLHKVNPYKWAPSHQPGETSSCTYCSGSDSRETHENWISLKVDHPHK